MGRCRCSQGGPAWGLASPGLTAALLRPFCTHRGDSWASPPAGFGCSPPGEALPPPCQNPRLYVTPRAGQLPPELFFSTVGGSGTRGGKVCSSSHKEPPARCEHNLRFLPPWRKEGASAVTREHHFLSGNPSARGGVGRRDFFSPPAFPVAETAG